MVQESVGLLYLVSHSFRCFYSIQSPVSVVDVALVSDVITKEVNETLTEVSPHCGRKGPLQCILGLYC